VHELGAVLCRPVLVRFYGHFGLAREERAELPDHVTVELEFMHFCLSDSLSL
jgi:nitrate reductase assembly molybdenum cofactor insertion protein NarJ